MGTDHTDPPDEPIVLLSNRAFAAIPPVESATELDAAAVEALEVVETRPEDDGVEVALSAAFEQTLVLHEPAQDYLRAQGVTDERTWAAFRLDAVTDADLVRLLTSTQRRQLRSSGIWLPTFDPRCPDTITGLIRMTPAQDQHRFVTAPVGIAGDPALADARRIVLTDNRLLAMRLHQRGVTGIAVVEDVAVLPPLIDWLRDRELIVVGTGVRSRATLLAALGQLGLSAQDLALRSDLDLSPAASLAALGLGPPVPQPPAVPRPLAVPQPPALTPFLLRDLCAYAVGRITAGTATEALRSVGITDPGFVAAFGIGYLPVTLGEALSADQQQALRGRIHPDAVVVPAYDDHGIIVDLLIVPVSGAHPPVLSLHAEPQGLIAPAVTTSYPAVVVVDTLQAAAATYASGQHQVVLLRGLSDAQANAPRLAANGIRRAVVRSQQEGIAIAVALQAAGITVADTLEEPRPVVVPTATATAPADLVLVQHDTQAELATFRAGNLTYIAEVPWDDRTLVSVTIQRGSHEHPDRIDLGSAAQRRRCASSAAMRTGAPEAVIAAHLARLDDAIRGLAERVATPPERATPGVTMTEAERTAALALAQTPDLLDRMVADLEHLGWVGETSAKRFTILAALSRLTDDPVWVALTGAGPAGLDAIAAITPPEDAIHVSRLTDSAFYYAEPSALRHKLLLIDDASRISPGVATALRVLKRRGALSASRVSSDPVHGQTRTTFVEVHGPIAVMTATDGVVDPQLAAHLIEIAADESPAQVEAVLAARRHRCAVGTDGERGRITARLTNLQRVLAAQPVLIPYAERITGFGTSAFARRDHATALALLAAHALLYQHQRQILDGAVVATEADFTVVADLMNERQAAQDAGLGRHAQRLLAAMWSAQLTTCTMDDLGRLLPDWTRYAFRAALDELVALDYLGSSRSGRGMARTYHLYGSPGAGSSIRMALRAVGELATVGENEFANSTPQVVNG